MCHQLQLVTQRNFTASQHGLVYERGDRRDGMRFLPPHLLSIPPHLAEKHGVLPPTPRTQRSPRGSHQKSKGKKTKKGEK